MTNHLSESGEAVAADVAGMGAGLAAREARLAVWGLGYIGSSTAEAFAAAGVDVIGYDPDSERVAVLRASQADKKFAVSSAVAAVLHDDCRVHMIAVPTEREGEPFNGALVSVFTDLAHAIADGPLSGTCPLVVIESTLPPGTTEEVLFPLLVKHGLTIGRDLLVGLAPRRDWFLAEGYGLRELDRIYSGVDDLSAIAVRDVLALVNDVLHQAPSHLEGELVKCVENAYRHMDITLANELSLAFPHVDMVEVLRLAGTKWNIGTYHPSFGTGGYCIPLSSRYLITGARHPQELGLLRRAVETDDRMRILVADAVRSRPPVVILGIAYKGGIKVDILSPAKAIVQRLLEHGVEVTVHDPMYTNEEIEKLLGVGVTTDDVAGALRAARTVLIIPDHPEFTDSLYMEALNHPREGGLRVIDNHGVLAAATWADHVKYSRAGGENWLESEKGLDQ